MGRLGGTACNGSCLGRMMWAQSPGKTGWGVQSPGKGHCAGRSIGRHNPGWGHWRECCWGGGSRRQRRVMEWETPLQHRPSSRLCFCPTKRAEYFVPHHGVG